MATRRKEDKIACARLGAAHKHFSIPDCIYRRSPLSGKHLYDSETAIFSSVHPTEAELLASLRALLEKHLPPQARLMCPLGLGGHVDHRLTRAAAEMLEHPLWYYADYPYVLRSRDDIPGLLPQGWVKKIHPIDEADLRVWVESVAAHHSQISTFWKDLSAMQAAIHEYSRDTGGVWLWSPPAETV